MKNIIFFICVLFISGASIYSDEKEKLFIPVNLTKLDWYGKIGFTENDILLTDFSKLNDYKKINTFPIIINSVFKIPISFDKVNEITLKCNFKLNLERIDKGKELAFLFSGIGETWSVYLNGEKIKDEFNLENSQIKKYRAVRNAVVSIPYGLLKEDNSLTIHMAGYSPTSIFSPNILFGLRFKDGYILDYEKKIQENIGQTSLLLFNTVYIFFGLYHLFFFVRWIEKKYNLYFGIFSISISTYFLSFSNIAFDNISDTRILIYLAYVSQPIALMSFILFLYDYFYSSKLFSFFIKYTIASNSFIIIAFSILKVNFYLTFLYFWYILIIAQIIYIFYFIINATKKGLKDAVLMASSILVILLIVIWEILDTIIFQTGIKLLQFAYFAFIISMVIILANRFIEINWETRRLNIELTHQRDSFSKFVPIQFLDLLGKHSAGDILLGECKLQEMTILFADIRDFTSLSESMSPEENFKFINSYLKRMSPIIERNNGFIDKFIGDAIMAIFQLPEDGLKASIDMIHELEIFNEGRKISGYRTLKIGIGLNTGMLMMGTIGHEDRLSTTVIGDSVNLAARLESLTKDYSIPILISEFVVSKLARPEKYCIREADAVIVKGKTNSVKIYECYQNDPDDLKERKNSSKKKLEEAILLLENGSYKSALDKLLIIKTFSRDDSIVNYHINKCRTILSKL